MGTGGPYASANDVPLVIRSVIFDPKITCVLCLNSYAFMKATEAEHAEP